MQGCRTCNFVQNEKPSVSFQRLDVATGCSCAVTGAPTYARITALQRSLESPCARHCEKLMMRSFRPTSAKLVTNDFLDPAEKAHLLRQTHPLSIHLWSRVVAEEPWSK